MLITRKLINKNIIYHDCYMFSPVNMKDYDYNYVSSLIDAYKNLFLVKGARSGQTVVIGTAPRVEQFALVLACAELGMSVTIVGDIVGKSHSGFINDSYKNLLPIDFFIVCSENCTPKFFQLFNEICTTTILLDKEHLDYTQNDILLALDDSVFLKCIGKDGVICHTHKFFAELICRNSTMYYGKMGMISNLNHGSSPGTYFLPGLVSDSVTDFYNFTDIFGGSPSELPLFLTRNNTELNHLMISYTKLLDEFFESNATLNNCTIYTLSIIRLEWANRLRGKAKDIISIFGTNETSGPVLINQATDTQFTEDSYRKLDSFYDIDILNGKLVVKMPVYGTTINTNDSFTLVENRYKHHGKANLHRINDLEVDVIKYQTIVNKLLNAELVIDTIKDRIYLAIREPNIDENLISELNTILSENSNGRHFISKYGYIGSNLDSEDIKEYFRKQ